MRPMKKMVCSGGFAEAVWTRTLEEARKKRRDIVSAAEDRHHAHAEQKPSDGLKRKRCDWEFCSCDDRAECFTVVA